MQIATYEQVRTAIVTHVDTTWRVAGVERTPIEWMNREFHPPVNAPWARFILSFQGAEDVTIPLEPLNRAVGIVSFDIFVPLNSGDLVMMQLVNEAVKMFSRKTVTPVQFRAASPTFLGEDPPFFQHRVNTPFWFFTRGDQ
jgi:hypothetical protein